VDEIERFEALRRERARAMDANDQARVEAQEARRHEIEIKRRAQAEAKTARLHTVERERAEAGAEASRQRSEERAEAERQERERLRALLASRTEAAGAARGALEAARARFQAAVLAGEDTPSLRDLWRAVEAARSEVDRLAVEVWMLDVSAGTVKRAPAPPDCWR
jgi:hypothetical protein